MGKQTGAIRKKRDSQLEIDARRIINTTGNIIKVTKEMKEYPDIIDAVMEQIGTFDDKSYQRARGILYCALKNYFETVSRLWEEKKDSIR